MPTPEELEQSKLIDQTNIGLENLKKASEIFTKKMNEFAEKLANVFPNWSQSPNIWSNDFKSDLINDLNSKKANLVKNHYYSIEIDLENGVTFKNHQGKVIALFAPEIMQKYEATNLVQSLIDEVFPNPDDDEEDEEEWEDNENEGDDF